MRTTTRTTSNELAILLTVARALRAERQVSAQATSILGEAATATVASTSQPG